DHNLMPTVDQHIAVAKVTSKGSGTVFAESCIRMNVNDGTRNEIKQTWRHELGHVYDGSYLKAHHRVKLLELWTGREVPQEARPVSLTSDIWRDNTYIYGKPVPHGSGIELFADAYKACTRLRE